MGSLNGAGSGVAPVIERIVVAMSSLHPTHAIRPHEWGTQISDVESALDLLASLIVRQGILFTDGRVRMWSV